MALLFVAVYVALIIYYRYRGHKNKLHGILAKMDLDHSGTVSEAEFVKNCLKNKSLLFPTVRYQLDFRAKILSHPFWSRREGRGTAVLHQILQIRAEIHRSSASHSSAPTDVNTLTSAMASSVKDTEAHGNGNHHHNHNLGQHK